MPRGPLRFAGYMLWPSGPARESDAVTAALAREFRQSLWRSLPAGLLAGLAGLILVAVSASYDQTLVGVALVVVGAPSVVVILRWLRLRRLALPAMEALLWSASRRRLDWAALDGGGSPASEDEALARIGDREDDAANRLRVRWFLAANATAEAEGVLDRWHPSDPVAVAGRELQLSAVAFARGQDDLSAPTAAAGNIEDETARRAQMAAIPLERARRLAVANRDPLPALVEAREILGRDDLRGLQPAANGGRRLARSLAVVGVALAVVFAGAWALGPKARGEELAFAYREEFLTAAGRRAPGPFALPDSTRNRAVQIVEDALPRVTGLGRSGPTMVAAGVLSTCDSVCVEWAPHGRSTSLPPEANGSRITSVRIDLGDVVSGTGPALAYVWFATATSSASASASGEPAAGAPSVAYRLDSGAGNSLVELLFPRG